MITYRVNEIFYSLQGEGFHTGTPAVFLRFSGCNLKCGFCDTDHQQYKEMTLQEIADTISGYPSRHIVLTGGEPSLQTDDIIIDMLHQLGFFIQIETNGTHPVPESIDWITCSPKDNAPVLLSHIDELKVVYQNQNVEAIADANPASHYFLQPCSCKNTEEVVSYILSHPHWRLSLQTHKLINIR